MDWLIISGETATSIFTVDKYVKKAKMMQDTKREDSSSVPIFLTIFDRMACPFNPQVKATRSSETLVPFGNRIRRDCDLHSSLHGYVTTSDVMYSYE
jgi:hypothetical protein